MAYKFPLYTLKTYNSYIYLVKNLSGPKLKFLVAKATSAIGH